VILVGISSADLPSTQAVSVDGREPPFEIDLGGGMTSDHRYSPDGRWIAYVSDVSGLEQVYIVRYPEPSGIAQVSAAGGRQPLWSPAGDELFFISGTAVMAVDVRVQGGELRTGKPRRLFEGPFHVDPRQIWSYDARNQRFLMIQRSDEEMWNDRFVVVTDWIDDLERLLSAEE
jgi:Tol biopolymer transport system component